MEKLRLSQSGPSVKLPKKLFEFEPTHASRYWILANILTSLKKSENIKVLDVGGKKGLLRFFPGFAPTILDVEESDEPKFVQGDALNMQFEDDAFDFAVCCDVLEHIPAKDRKKFITEMLRVSKRGIVICAPFNNKGVPDAEKEMNAYFKQLTNTDHRWLKEHIDNGLPSEKLTENVFSEQGLDFVKFHHFSIETWKAVVKIHLLQFAFQESKELLDAANQLYKYYYEQMCNVDYSKSGYRTFYVVSKKGKITAELPALEETEEQRREFIRKTSDSTTSVLESTLTELRSKQKQLVKQNEDIQKLNEQLQAIVTSKRWQTASKAASVKAKVLRKK